MQFPKDWRSVVFALITILLFTTPAMLQAQVNATALGESLINFYGSGILDKKAGLISSASVSKSSAFQAVIAADIIQAPGERGVRLLAILLDENGRPLPQMSSTGWEVANTGQKLIEVTYNGSGTVRSSVAVILMHNPDTNAVPDSLQIPLQRQWGEGTGDDGSAAADSSTSNMETNKPEPTKEPSASVSVQEEPEEEPEDVVVTPVAIAGTPTPEEERAARRPNTPKPKYELKTDIFLDAKYLRQVDPKTLRTIDTTNLATGKPSTSSSSSSNNKPSTNNSTSAKTTLTLNPNITRQVLSSFVNLYALAPKAVWRNGPDTLPFNGRTNDNRGFVRHAGKARMSDGKFYDNVLYTHPRWVDRGIIIGTYDISVPSTASHFRTKIGLLNGAQSNNAFQFTVVYNPDNAGARTLVNQRINYASGVRDINVALPAYVKGTKGKLTMLVRAVKSSGRGWCAWVNPRFQ